jgi:hypothetical protein
MKKFEYTYFYTTNVDDINVCKKLNTYGKDGWSLAWKENSNGEYIVWLEREIDAATVET